MLIGLTGDWDLAEECAQEAFARAAKRWPHDGVPQRPGAWLTMVARNRAIDVLRRASREAVWLQDAATVLPGGDDSGGPGSCGFDGHETDFADDRLRLIPDRSVVLPHDTLTAGHAVDRYLTS